VPIERNSSGFFHFNLNLWCLGATANEIVKMDIRLSAIFRKVPTHLIQCRSAGRGSSLFCTAQKMVTLPQEAELAIGHQSTHNSLIDLPHNDHSPWQMVKVLDRTNIQQSMLIHVSKTAIRVSCPISSKMWVIAPFKFCRLGMSYSVSFRLI
jgi:hypothetical protein